MKAMLFSMLVIGLAVQAGPSPDTVVDPVTVYAPILEHIHTEHPDLPLMLDESLANVECPPRCGDRAERVHPPEVLRRLREGEWIHTSCFVPHGCPSRKSHVFVSLGPVIELSDSARVKVVPGGRVPGVPLDQVLEAIPDSEAVPVDAAVDVVVGTPCPAPPESERCRVPDVISYRYFLQWKPEGTYRIVTRWMTGAI